MAPLVSEQWEKFTSTKFVPCGSWKHVDNANTLWTRRGFQLSNWVEQGPCWVCRRDRMDSTRSFLWFLDSNSANVSNLSYLPLTFQRFHPPVRLSDVPRPWMRMEYEYRNSGAPWQRLDVSPAKGHGEAKACWQGPSNLWLWVMGCIDSHLE